MSTTESDVENIDRKKEFTSNHAIDMLSKLNEERKSSKSHCDVTIKSGDQEFPAHKCVLGALSDFYDKMFTSEMKEKYERVARVDGVNAETMQIIMDFIYTCKITITMENVYDILKGADYMQMMSVKEYCASFLLNQIDFKTCLRILACSKTYNLVNVRAKSERFVSDHFEWVIQESELTYLDIDDISTLLHLKNRIVSSEKIVYNAVVDWVKCDIPQRTQFFSSLFQTIKLERLPREFLNKTVFGENLVMNSQDCVAALLKAISSHVPSEDPTSVCSQFLVMGGEACNSVIKYDVIARKWVDMLKSSSELLTSHDGTTAVNFDNHIFVIGGRENFVEKLCLTHPTSAWTKVTPMIMRRRYPSSAVLDGYIYVTGGNTIKAKCSCERYDPQSSIWIMDKEMNQARTVHGVVSLQGKLYAVGGLQTTDRRFLNSCECFNPLNELWKMVSPMKIARAGLATVVLNDEIYAIGGFDGNRCLSSVEKYNPQTDTWCEVASLLVARDGACACVVNGKIYVVGGANDGEYVLSVEVFDPVTSKWKLEAELVTGKFRSAIACV